MSFDLALPGWLSDVDVAVGRVPASLTNGPGGAGVLWQATAAGFLLGVPGVARYLVRDGRSIVVHPEPGCAPGDVSRFLHAAPFAALCYQRRLCVLHAAAATRGQAAALVAGNSSAGKSALLAELLMRGWRMIADDVAPIALDEDGRPIVLPTFPELTLWSDVPDRLRVAPTIAPREFACTSTPLDTIWWLSVDNLRREVEVEALPPIERFSALGALAYNRRIADAILDPSQRLNTDAPISSAVPVRRVTRPRGRWTVTELADLIESAYIL
jgi:hypothetical protein